MDIGLWRMAPRLCWHKTRGKFVIWPLLFRVNLGDNILFLPSKSTSSGVRYTDLINFASSSLFSNLRTFLLRHSTVMARVSRTVCLLRQVPLLSTSFPTAFNRRYDPKAASLEHLRLFTPLQRARRTLICWIAFKISLRGFQYTCLGNGRVHKPSCAQCLRCQVYTLPTFGSFNVGLIWSLATVLGISIAV